jgi:hypothetical protein
MPLASRQSSSPWYASVKNDNEATVIFRRNYMSRLCYLFARYVNPEVLMEGGRGSCRPRPRPNHRNVHDCHGWAVDFVSDFARRRGLKETFEHMRRFMVSYLTLMEDSLPAAAKKALAVSAKFVAGEGNREDLVAERVACWAYLKSKGITWDFSNYENLAIRATLGPLCAEPNMGDPNVHVEWFLHFADNIEDHSAEIPSLIDKHFGASVR